MFNLLKRKEKKQEHEKAEKAAAWLSKAITALQTRWATWLSKREQRMSTRQKKIALFIFCGALSIISGTALYKGVFGHHSGSSLWLKHQTIQPPVTAPFPDSVEIMYLLEKEKRNAENKHDSIHP